MQDATTGLLFALCCRIQHCSCILQLLCRMQLQCTYSTIPTAPFPHNHSYISSCKLLLAKYFYCRYLCRDSYMGMVLCYHCHLVHYKNAIVKKFFVISVSCKSCLHCVAGYNYSVYVHCSCILQQEVCILIHFS